MPSSEREAWDAYREEELRRITPIIANLGYTLDVTQVHTGGERFLMAGARDVGGGGLKLVLVGRDTKTGKRVIIKVSNSVHGIAEIERERECREILHKLQFASRAFRTPEELLYTKEGPYVISVTSYIEQERAFIEHSLDEQFFLALRAFETQEGVHATTYSHAQTIKKTFGMVGVQEYLEGYDSFMGRALAADPGNAELTHMLERGRKFLHAHRTDIERYSGFLTHADFVPNNLRVAGRDLFLLDYASVHFGNKYESWARFLNFMITHNTELERTLARYVRENRGEEEYLSLRLMRVYKIAFLLAFHTEALLKTSGNLHELTRRRVHLWTEAMSAVLEDKDVPDEVIASYVGQLDRLRSDDEKARQKEILGGK